jgi:hypothetical protein
MLAKIKFSFQRSSRQWVFLRELTKRVKFIICSHQLEVFSELGKSY